MPYILSTNCQVSDTECPGDYTSMLNKTLIWGIKNGSLHRIAQNKKSLVKDSLKSLYHLRIMSKSP